MQSEVPAASLSVVPLLEPYAGPVLYGLSLATVFLLAFRGRWADRAISLVLAVLWACMAAALCVAGILVSWPAAWPRSAGGPLLWLAVLFAVQSLLFLGEGVLRRGREGRGRLSFEPRASAGPVAGGLFLLYSLIVHPVLAVFHVPPFPQSVLGLPFHGVLFTFGLLLFLERDFPRYVLVLPLLWAAIGGLTAFYPGEPDYWGLLVALVAGLFLALPRRRTFTDVEGNPRLETLYEHAARHHRKCGRLVLFLLLATCMLGFLVAGAKESGHPAYPLIQHLEISVALAAALILGIWLSLPAWYSAGFRLLAWEAGRWLRGIRRGWDWLTARWMAVLLLLGLAVYGTWQIYDELRAPEVSGGAGAAQATAPEKAAAAAQETPAAVKADEARKEKVEESTEKILVLLGFAVLVLYAVYRARRRIIISEFLDHTGEEGMERLAKGLSSRLHNELANITSLYRTIDEAMPPQKGSVVGVTVGVEDVLEPLNDLMGPDSSVKLGKIEIPIGLLFRGWSRLVRGPRLTGSLHKEGQDYLVLADLSGGGFSGSWRVSFRDLEPGQQQPGSAAVYRMAEQLAYRIITGFGNLGSPRWEAVRHFTQGLRAYRTTQVVKADASPELRAAEREFVMALSMDRNFSQCHYNLGVIYQGLRVHESAEAAFRQILSEDPDWSEAYYALATVYYEAGQYQKAAIFARKMIEIRPGDARAWNLNGLARFLQREREAQDRGDLEQEFRGPAWREIVRSFKIAAAVAWRSLCTAALKDSSRSLRKERLLAVRCVNNLAIVKGDEGAGDARRAILEQSFRLSPRDPRAHLICGESLFEEKEWASARTELYQVFGDALDIQDHVLRWIYLLGAHSAQWTRTWSRHDRADVLRAYACLVNHMVPSEALVLAVPGNAEAEAARREYGEQLKTFEILLKLVARRLAPGPDPCAAPLRLVGFLRKLELDGQTDAALEGLPSDQLDWGRAQVHIYQARQDLDKRPGEVAQRLRTAIELLEGQQLLRQVEQQGICSLLARACLLDALRGGRSRLGDAVHRAEESVAQQPGSGARRWILADVYSAIGDFKEACEERETALRLGPGHEILDDLASLGRIAHDYLLLAGPPERRAPEERVRRGRDFFERVLRLAESRRSTRSQSSCQAHAVAHYWMGRFQCELGESDEGVEHLRIARSLSFRPLEIGLRLGNVYGLKQDYGEAERAFVDSLRTNRRNPLGDAGEAQAARALEVEILLSWAMLWAEQGVRLKQAARVCESARKRILAVKGGRGKDLRALYHECLGWTLFQDGKLDESRQELERAARLSGSPGLQLRLARVYEAASERRPFSSQEDLRKAAEARRKSAAVNGHGPARGVFDLPLSQIAAAQRTPAAETRG